MDKWDHLASTSAVDSKIGYISCDYRVPRVQFAHPDQAQVCEIGRTVVISLRQICQLLNVLCRGKAGYDQTTLDELEYQPRVLQMECGF